MLDAIAEISLFFALEDILMNERIRPPAACPAVSSLAARGLRPMLDDVCRRYAVTADEICGRGRTKNVSRARKELWWRLRNRDVSTFSFVELGRIFERDHTTIMAGVKSFEERSYRTLGTAVGPSVVKTVAVPPPAPSVAA